MADTGKRFTNNRVDLLSKAQEKSNSSKQQAASSSAAVKSGSTTVPTTTQTPKVTNTAKAMPTATAMLTLNRVDVSKISTPTTTPTTTNTVSRESVKDLFAKKTPITGLRKADTTNLLNKSEENKEIKNTTLPLNVVRVGINMGGDIASSVVNTLYEQGLDWVNDKFNKLKKVRENVTQAVGQGAIDLFKSTKEDLSTQWQTGQGLGATKDFVLNTVQGLPRGITRIEYGLSELLDWGIDAQWATDLKNSIKSDLDYWENTRTYKKIKETEGFSDFLKNPLMYAGGTLSEMLPMFINAWVAVPTTFAQIYGETYEDYSQDESLRESGLNDNQIRLMSLGVAGVNTIIELGSDLFQGLMPWTKTLTKTTEKEVRKSLTKPLTRVFSSFTKGGLSEGFEEVFQNEIQDQVAGFKGSDRELPTWADRLTTFGISTIIGWILQGGNVVVNVKQNKEMETAFNEWSEAVDKIAPGVSKDDKVTLFSAIVAAEVEDANMSKERVSKYETQTTELYNKIDELTEQLNNTTNEQEKQEINRQIEDANQKIKNIDEIINKGNAMVEQVNQQLQELSKQTETIPQEEETKVSFDSVVESKPVENMTEDELVKAVEYWKNTKPTTPQERQRKRKIEVEYNNKLNDFVAQLTEADVKTILNRADTEESVSLLKLLAVKKWLSNMIIIESDRNNRNIFSNMFTEVNKKIDAISQGGQQTEERDTESLLPETEINSNLFFDNLSKRLGMDIDAYALRIFNQDRQHLPGLKGVKIGGVENITDADIMEVANALAKVSQVLGIDFNKILDNTSFGLLDLKGEKVKGAENIYGRQITQADRWTDALNLAIIMVDVGPSTLGHELMHLLDVEYKYRKTNKFRTDGKKHISRESSFSDASFRTYKDAGKNYGYWDSYREILARYAEQYIAYKLDKDGEYKNYTNQSYFWNDTEFKKLIPKFEKFMDSHFSEFKLDEGDRNTYAKIMQSLTELQYSQTQFSYGTETEMIYKLADMKDQYDMIEKELGNVKNETLRLELETEASRLYSNFAMLNKMKGDYMQKLITSQEMQDLMDTITTTVLPPVETPENPNPTPSENPNVIRLGLPYYGGSNIEDGIGNIADGGNGEQLGESYMSEEAIVKTRKKKNKIKAFKKGLSQAWNDLFTPAITRIYNRSPRIAGRLITMEAQTEVNIHRYRQKAKGFVESLGKLEGKQALEVKMALLDYGALASEQGENIEEYKKEEVAKLKEVLKRNGFKEKDINDMFSVLDDIGKQYKDSGLNITLTDMYFPRVVKDYEGLIDYMNRMSDDKIKVNKTSLLIRISQIQADPEMTDAEKERRIRNVITMEFKQPGTTSKHGKERKMGKLSDWGEGIFAYYENPIQSLDHYITTMVNAIQRQLFLGGLREDANLEGDIVNESTAESISQIIGNLVEQGMVNEDDVEVLQKSILAILNKAPSPKIVTTTKNITYVATITNFLSAINQLDDLGMTILKDRSGLKNVVKAIFGKANIKYDELGLEDSYEMFREGMGITNWLFKKSGFNFFDRLGKTSFVNAAWESMVRQAKNKKTRDYLYTRLEAMYGKESADRMMEKIDSGNYNGDDGQIDIEILRDLLYQLGSTQPIFTSAMPTTYLNHPWARLCYALSSFTLKRIDWLVQGTKEVNAKHGPVVAGAWLMGVSTYLAIFGMIIGDAGDYLKGKKEETFLWKFLNEGIDEALKAGGSNALDSWLKIWDLSEYDIKTYKQQGLWGVLSAKIKPFIFDLGKDFKEAIVEHDKDEITDLAKYVPIFGKLVYYWCWDDLGKKTKKDDGDFELNLDGDFDLNLDNDFELNLDDDFELNI